MAETATKKHRQSSPRFPFISLQKALDRATQLRKAGGGGPVLVSAARQTWGYGPKSSGGHQTIAAMKSYGLIEEIGGGDHRQLKLTEKASRYFRDEREDVRSALRKEFALSPKAMHQAWADWSGPPPEAHVARSHLKVVRGFADNAAEEFLAIYVANISFSKLTPSDKVTIDVEGDDEPDNSNDDEIEVGDLIQAEVNGQLAFPKPARVRAIQDGWLFVDGHMAGVQMENAELVGKGVGAGKIDPPLLPLPEAQLPEGWQEERLIDESGDEIVVRYKGKPSQERYAYLRDYYSFKLARLKKD